MTEKFTEKRIREAIINTIQGVESLPGADYAEKVIAELTRPKHQFAEGQVIIDLRPRENMPCYSDEMAGPHWRHQNLTELGPTVRELRDAVMAWSRPSAARNPDLEQALLDALARFDAVHGGE